MAEDVAGQPPLRRWWQDRQQACSPVHGILPVEVFQAAQDLCRVKQGPLLLEARITHVVDMELQVTPVHDGQNQAQRVLGLVGVGQVDLGAQDSTTVTVQRLPSLPLVLLRVLEAGGGGLERGPQHLHGTALHPDSLTVALPPAPPGWRRTHSF